MNVGLTYDLRDDYLSKGYSPEHVAEFDSVETIDAIEAALVSLGSRCDRIGGIQPLTERLVRGERWDLVFNIAEGLNGIARESQVPALLEAYGIPYTFSDPIVLGLTMHKGLSKHAVRSMGIATADFAVVESAADIEAVRLPFPLFVKPVAEGSSKGISASSKIHTEEDLQRQCRDLLDRFQQPVLVEPFLSGREFTVGMIGTGREAASVGVLEILLNANADREIYTYGNKSDYETRVRYELVQGLLAAQAGALALRVWRRLGCRDAGRIDLRCDADGRLQFLEVNPLAGLNPKHSDLPILCSLAGIPYRDLIRMIYESAIKRVPQQPARQNEAVSTRRCESIVVRPLAPLDRDDVDTLIRSTDNFISAEVALAHELMDAIFEQPGQTDYHGVVAEISETAGRRIAGLLIVGPRAATVGTWDLYWIAVSPEFYGAGVAQQLDVYAESYVRSRAGYWLIAETSGQPKYERSQGFYRKQRYQLLARIPDFYAPADDLVIYGKRLK